MFHSPPLDELPLEPLPPPPLRPLQSFVSVPRGQTLGSSHSPSLAYWQEFGPALSPLERSRLEVPPPLERPLEEERLPLSESLLLPDGLSWTCLQMNFL